MSHSSSQQPLTQEALTRSDRRLFTILGAMFAVLFLILAGLFVVCLR